MPITIPSFAGAAAAFLSRALCASDFFDLEVDASPSSASGSDPGHRVGSLRRWQRIFNGERRRLFNLVLGFLPHFRARWHRDRRIESSALPVLRPPGRYSIRQEEKRTWWIDHTMASHAFGMVVFGGLSKKARTVQ